MKGIFYDSSKNADATSHTCYSDLNGWENWGREVAKLKVPQFQLLNVHQGLVETHLRYANVVWGALSDDKLRTLQ